LGYVGTFLLAMFFSWQCFLIGNVLGYIVQKLFLVHKEISFSTPNVEVSRTEKKNQQQLLTWFFSTNKMTR